MQTNFTSEQLASPRIAEADKILRKCVHCGLCTATCSTYVLLGDERDSPRGRIYLIKDMLEEARQPSATVQRHVDRCLSCLSCMTTCPSGVDYMHLVDLARAEIHEAGTRSVRDRFMRSLLAGLVPYPARLRLALLGGSLAKPLKPLLERLGLKELAAMLMLAPSLTALMPRFRRQPNAVIAEKRGRVALLKGCAQKVLRPEINAATERLLARIGMEVVSPPAVGCCGALVHHMGREREAQQQAARNVEAWAKADAETPLTAIVINASGCGTTVKDYGHLLSRYDDGSHADWAKYAASITKDVTEILAAHDLGAPLRWSSLRVAYHSACSMQHGQRITDQPRALLKRAGFALVEIAEGHICCGSAGVYNILQPDIARDLRDRKLANIDRVRPDIIATGNLGCITQLQSGTDIPVVHTVELIDWAFGGPCPRGLEHLKDRVVDVPEAASLPSMPAA
ncbi:MAG: glycolate oxidase subunit GlcF [Rhizobiales bacterium]|nr:glycolate oxidase subunit GlcF [Hyphomicrobiales bacterium]